MKRRKFLRLAAVAPVAAAALNPMNLAQGQIPPNRPPQGGRPRGGFPMRDQGPVVYVPTGPGIHVRFLGTGAADWFGPAENGELRRHASILADGKVLFDFTPSAADMVPEGANVEVVFFTHSHSDHYDPKATLELGVKRVYLGETWLERAQRDFMRASEQTGKPVPEIIPLKFGQSVEEHGIKVTPLPANHASNVASELTLIYLLEKDSFHLVLMDLQMPEMDGGPGRKHGQDPHADPQVRSRRGPEGLSDTPLQVGIRPSGRGGPDHSRAAESGL